MRLIDRLLIRNTAWSEPPIWSPDRNLLFTGMTGDRETIGNDYLNYAHHLFKGNGVVFACIQVRMLAFSEARFQWRRMEEGRPGELFPTSDLKILETPWPNGTTGELLAWMEQDVSLAGNYFGARIRDGTGDRIRRMRPDWTTVITGSKTGDPWALDATPIGYMYKSPRSDGILLTPEQVVHYLVTPDPAAQWRGMSWLTPILNEVAADSAATKHKKKFFDNGAIPGLVVSYDASLSQEQFDAAVELFKETYAGVDMAYKTLHLGGGADVNTVGADLQQLDFKVSQGASETRIAMAAGTHPVVVGMSEGMQGSSLNAGNFSAARRRFADLTIRPLWRIASAALQTILRRPADADLGYDDRHIAFLRQDAKEEAEIDQIRAATIRALTDAGYNSASVIDAVVSGDFTRLQHSGLFSVQLQKPAGASDD